MNISVRFSLFTFREKIQDAIGMVPSMAAEDKLEAVRLWNVTSEKLQEIVNSYAADLSAVAAQLPQYEHDRDSIERLSVYPDQTLSCSTAEPQSPMKTKIKEQAARIPDSPRSALRSLLTDESYPASLQAVQRSTSPIQVPPEPEKNCPNSLASFLDIPCDGVQDLDADDFPSNSSSPCNEGIVVPTSPESEKNILQSLCEKENEEQDLTKISVAQDAVNVSQEDSVKRYKCPECETSFRTRAYLVCHLRTHTGEKPFPCPKCPSRFTTVGNLNRHVRSHDGIKPFECDICNGRFSEKKSLIVHQRQHTGERPFQCAHCDMRFSYQSVLASHIACHLNIKEHLCEECGKAFRQKSQLRMHLLRHKGVRRYHCHCAASFLVKGDYLRHMKTHTGEKSFSCDVCGKSFGDQRTLDAHRNRHFGLRPYQCPHCAKSFGEVAACRKHLKTHSSKLSLEV